MQATKSVHSAVTWGKSHLVLLVVIICLALIGALVGWYYVDSIQQTTQSSVEQSDFKRSSLTAPIDSATLLKTTTIESVNPGAVLPVITTEVQVGDQKIQGPQNGSVHKVISGGGGTTTVNISTDSNTSGNSGTNSSMTIELNSTTEINSSHETSQ